MVAKFGQTIGKMIMGIKIIDFKTQTNVSLKQSIYREIIPFILMVLFSVLTFIIFEGEDLTNFELTPLGYFIVFMPAFIAFFWSVIEIVTMISDNKGRALHDKIAGTVVVKLKYHNI